MVNGISFMRSYDCQDYYNNTGEETYIQELIVLLIHSRIREIVELSALNQNIAKNSDKGSANIDILMIANAQRVLESTRRC